MRRRMSGRDSPITEPIRHTLSMRVELRIPADAQLQNRRDRGVADDPSAVRLIHAADDLQQRALAAAVAAHDPERLAAAHREADAVEHLQPLNRRGSSMPSTCSRTVLRCTVGIQNAFDTASTSMTVTASS